MHGPLNVKCFGVVNNIANDIEFLSNGLPEDDVTNNETYRR